MCASRHWRLLELWSQAAATHTTCLGLADAGCCQQASALFWMQAVQVLGVYDTDQHLPHLTDWTYEQSPAQKCRRHADIPDAFLHLLKYLEPLRVLSDDLCRQSTQCLSCSVAYSNELVPCHIDNVLDIMMLGHVTDVWFHTSVAQADSTVTAIETSAASVKHAVFQAAWAQVSTLAVCTECSTLIIL